MKQIETEKDEVRGRCKEKRFLFGRGRGVDTRSIRPRQVAHGRGSVLGAIRLRFVLQALPRSTPAHSRGPGPAAVDKPAAYVSHSHHRGGARSQ